MTRRQLALLALGAFALGLLIAGCDSEPVGPSPVAAASPAPSPTPDPACTQVAVRGYAFFDDDAAARPIFAVHVGTYFWLRAQPLNGAGAVINPVSCRVPTRALWSPFGSAACTPLSDLGAMDVPMICWSVGSAGFVVSHNGHTSAPIVLLVNP